MERGLKGLKIGGLFLAYMIFFPEWGFYSILRYGGPYSRSFGVLLLPVFFAALMIIQTSIFKKDYVKNNKVKPLLFIVVVVGTILLAFLYFMPLEEDGLYATLSWIYATLGIVPFTFFNAYFANPNYNIKKVLMLLGGLIAGIIVLQIFGL